MKTTSIAYFCLFFLTTLISLTFAPIGHAQISERGAGVSASTSESPKNVYGLIVGVSEYKYVTPLNYAANDANLIANVIRSNFAESKIELELLTNKLATELAIKSGLHKINQQVKSGDLVIFYFAGHGDVAYIEGSQRGYFLAHNASDSRDYEAGGAVRFDAVHDSIQSITNKGAKVYLITDACRSGKIIDTKGTSTTLAAFNTGYENTTKFISCQSSEVSYELDELAHGIFTYFLTKGISGEGDSGNKDEKISVREMDNYLTDALEDYLSGQNKKQTPTVFGANKNSVIFTIDPKVTAFFAQNGGSQDLAMRATKQTDPTRIKFEQALLNMDLYGKSTSAQFILETAIRSKSVPANQLEEMKMQLADALMDRAQSNMNKFLSGKPLLDKTADFVTSAKDLKQAAEILGKDHFMFASLMNRSAFFEALTLLQSPKQESLIKAENILITLERNDPKATYVHQGLAHLYILKNDKIATEKSLSEAQRRIETWTKPYNTSAHLNILAGQLNKAMEQLTKAEQLSSDPSDVYLLRSQMQLANFQLMEVQKELNKLQQSAPGGYALEKALLKGKMEELRGRIQYAENAYKDVLKTDETNVTILLKLAELYASQKDTIRALEFYTKVLKLEPQNYTAKSSTQLLNGKNPDTFTDFHTIDAVVSILNSYDQAGKYTEGLKLVNEALSINNWSPEYYFQQGKFLYNLGRKSESVDALKKGIAISPYSYESIRALTLILIEQKKFTEADALIKQHDKYFSKSAKWLSFQYKAYRLMNSPNDLFVLLEKAIKMDSFDLEPHRELVALHVEYNGFRNAQNELNILMNIGGVERDRIQFLNRVDQQVRTVFKTKKYLALTDGVDILLKENPFDLDYLFMGSMVAYMNKDYAKANLHLKEIQKYLQSLTPGAQLNYYLLKGKVYLETGFYQEAESAFKMYNTKSSKPHYLGLAMAQFELNKKTEWPNNFNKDRDLSDFNEDAQIRYEKMVKKAGK